MTFTLYFQDMPKKEAGELVANFVPVQTIEAKSQAEAWEIAKRDYPRVRYPVFERKNDA